MNTERTLRERFVNWDWDWMPLWETVRETVIFHFHEHGWIAIMIAVFLLIVILLMTDMTSYITELVLASAVRSVFSAISMVLLGLLAITGITAGRVTIAKFRAALTVAGNSARRRKK